MSGNSFRTKLAADLDEDYDTIRDFLREAVKATRKVWHTCPDCNHRSEVEIPDIKAGLHAAQLWIDQGFGKAAQTAQKPEQPPIDPNLDIQSMTSAQRQPLIAQLRARIPDTSRS